MTLRTPLIALALLLATGCTRTVYIPVAEHRIEYTTLRDTVVTLTAPPDSVATVTPDTLSILHCGGATGTARIAGGMLHHTLTVAPRSDSVRLVLRERHVVDSIPYPVYIHDTPTHTPHRWWAIIFALLLARIVRHS